MIDDDDLRAARGILNAVASVLILAFVVILGVVVL
jgi:hypothetical protein